MFQEAEAYHLDALGDVAGRCVLDYGCGAGGATAHLLSRGARVTGFDISVARLLEARQRAPQAGLLSCAAEMLPFPDGAFDAVLGKQIRITWTWPSPSPRSPVCCAPAAEPCSWSR
ncbi:class I SAM-dependent methyltransferase [Candidatus Amarolinea aalborgensis]|uniref:class I SAM-dependent methyltransferase n=1 Tax=Candidatus Amarolinea aalborgensis TaxID=2249329 RepID=UPI003BF97951